MKRIYDEFSGTAVLVDRLWPRGVKKERVGLWLKEYAPSHDLRTAFHAGDLQDAEFASLYHQELDELACPDVPADAVFCTASKVPETSHLAVFASWLSAKCDH